LVALSYAAVVVNFSASHQSLVPTDLPMQHDFLPNFIDLEYWIAPTEIRIQVVKTDRHLHRHYRREKPCRIKEQQSSPPLSLDDFSSVRHPTMTPHDVNSAALF